MFQRRHAGAQRRGIGRRPRLAAAVDLTIYGAASLKGALAKAKTAYEAANPGTTLTISTDASSALATKIEQGAPADVFLSADTTNPQKLVDKGLADGAVVTFAGNQLTVIVPADNPAGITTPADLARPGVKVIAAGDDRPDHEVRDPARREPRQGSPATRRTSSPRYAANIVSKEDNVAAVVAKIELGEGDAGDRLRHRREGLDEGRRPSTFPTRRTSWRPTPASSSRRPRTWPRRTAFLTWLAGPDGQAILASFGFLPPVVIEDAHRSAPRDRSRLRPVDSRTGSQRTAGDWGEPVARRARRRSSRCSSALPVAALVARAILDGSLGVALASPVVLDGALRSASSRPPISLVLTVALGLPLACVLARRRFRGTGWSRPSSTCRSSCRRRSPGSRSCSCFGRRGLLGGAVRVPRASSVPFTTVAVILAQTFVSAPFFVRSARTGIAGVDRDLEDAARVDGASELQLFRSVTVPLAGAALAAGLVMSWARALGEFGATIMFAGNVEGRTQTLPLVVYGEFQGGDLDASIAAAAILVLAAFGVLVAVRVLHWGRALDLRTLG